MAGDMQMSWDAQPHIQHRRIFLGRTLVQRLPA
jgi:hypothetical protein